MIIFGASEHGRVVWDAARAAGEPVWHFADDDPEIEELCGVSVLATGGNPWHRLKHFRFIVAVGDNAKRAAIFGRLIEKRGQPVNVIHPFSCISPSARLGVGIVVCAGVVINPGAQVGDNCILNTSASIDHDCVVREHVHICPGARLAGRVAVGRGAMIGTGVSVIPGVRIGDWAVIGAGAAVVHDIPAHVTAYGVPAESKSRLDHRNRVAKPLVTVPPLA